jgi:hypothetical protein
LEAQMTGFVKVPLTRGKVALIDAADAEAVLRYRWHARRAPRNYYARTKIGGRQVELHRFLLGEDAGPRTDHRNRNGLDCRRQNLRPATEQQNQANRGPQRNNTSGFKGVGWHRPTRSWRAAIKVLGHDMTLGYFRDVESAAKAYDAAARKHFGEFAWTNFPVGS